MGLIRGQRKLGSPISSPQGRNFPELKNSWELNVFLTHKKKKAQREIMVVLDKSHGRQGETEFSKDGGETWVIWIRKITEFKKKTPQIHIEIRNPQLENSDQNTSH